MLDQMEEYVLYHGRDGGPLAGALEEVLTRADCPCTSCSASATTHSPTSMRSSAACRACSATSFGSTI